MDSCNEIWRGYHNGLFYSSLKQYLTNKMVDIQKFVLHIHQSLTTL